MERVNEPVCEHPEIRDESGRLIGAPADYLAHTTITGRFLSENQVLTLRRALGEFFLDAEELRSYAPADITDQELQTLFSLLNPQEGSYEGDVRTADGSCGVDRGGGAGDPDAQERPQGLDCVSD